MTTIIQEPGHTRSYQAVLSVESVSVPRLADSDPDQTQRGPLESLDGQVEGGSGELGLVDEHDSVPGDDPAVLVGRPARDQASHHYHSVVQVAGILQVRAQSSAALLLLQQTYLVVQDTETQSLLPLPEHHLHHLLAPGGGVGEDLQGPGAWHRAIPAE